MSGGGETRVSIPDNVKLTIKNIRDMTGKQHSDDEIYAVLRECSMDLDETAQKLLYLDTFHEVKSRKDRRKENSKGRASEDSRMPPGTQRRVSRGGGQGNYSSNFSSDAGGGRNYSARRENGANHFADRGPIPSPIKPVQKTKNTAAAPGTKASTGTPNGLKNLPNGNSTHGDSPKSPMGVDNNVREGFSAIVVKKSWAATPRPAVVASTPTFGSLDDEKSMSIPNQPSVSATPASASTVLSSASDPAMLNHTQGAKKGSGNAVDLELLKSEKTAPRSVNSVQNGKTSNDSKVAENNGDIKPSQPNLPSNHGVSSAQMPSNSDKQSQLKPTVPAKVAAQEVVTNAVEATSQLPRDSRISVAKHVTFPNHIQVPEALKNVLTFGSIDAPFGVRVDPVKGTGGDNFSMGAVESSQDTDETAKEPSPSNDIVSSRVQGDYSENPVSLANTLENLPPLDNVSSSTNSKTELPKQDSQVPPEGHQNPTILNAPSYNLGFYPSMLGSQLLQVEGHDNPAHETPRLPSFVGGNPAAVPSPNSTPPLPTSAAVSQQSIPMYRQTYPPNFYPYGHYLSPYYMPHMQQFLSHNGGFAQPSAGNVFLPPPPPGAAASGVKYSLPHLKPGANAGNPTQYSFQSGGPFITTAGGYASGPTVTTGSSVGNEDHGASQLKENHIYTTGQPTEGSAVWIPAPGQDMSGLQMSSMYNLTQGPRLTFSPMQAGHGGMPGMYPPGQTITSPTFLQQQSPAVAGAAETIGPQSAPYHQAQHTQTNWN